MIVLTNLCIQLIPFFVSFFPTSFEPPHTTTTSCFDRCWISIFAGFVIVLTPVPGVTNPWTLKPSSRFNFISAAHPHAWLLLVTIILCFFLKFHYHVHRSHFWSLFGTKWPSLHCHTLFLILIWILSHLHTSSKWFVSYRFSDQNCVPCLESHACSMSLPSHSPWFQHCNNIW